MTATWRETAYAEWEECDAEEEFWKRHVSQLEAACLASKGLTVTALSTDINDISILSTAAILHSIGRRKKYFAETDFGSPPDVAKSAQIARSILAADPLWNEYPTAMAHVVKAIDQLNSSSRVFPTRIAPGRTVRIGEVLASPTEDDVAAHLRECDALEHLENYFLRWTHNDGKIRHFPLSTPAGIAGAVPVWNACIAGNIRLLAKCAMRDVRTKSGEEKLRPLLHSAEVFLQEGEFGPGYDEELFGFDDVRSARSSDIIRDVGDETMQLLSGEPWGKLSEMIHNVTLERDPQVFAFSNADIELIRYVPDNLHPTAFYTLRSNLAFARIVHLTWLAVYGISPLDLGGRITWRRNGGQAWTIAPPFIESVESSDSTGDVDAILDGLHRIAFARSEGIKTVRAARIRGASVPFPIEPLTWTEVRVTDTVPGDEAKRVYRYETVADVKRSGIEFSIEITELIARHVFYRNLKAFGSTGVRGALPI